MTFLFAALTGVIGSELLLRLPDVRTVNQVTSLMQKSLRTIQSPSVSGHWKERVVLSYSLSLLKNTFILAIYFLIFIGAIIVVSLVPIRLNNSYVDFLISIQGILLITVISVVYITIRKPKKNNKYGFFTRFLHHLALGNTFIAEASFDIEQLVCKPDTASTIEKKHVFISGLTRAGTTILLRRFYSSGQFSSLTYRDMPFILMPNLWKKLSGFSRKESELEERAHQDGILVNYDSPEALDEVFWRVFTGKDYILKDRLIPVDIDKEVIEKFQSYISAITQKDKLYLSKNNNNILRLKTISEAFQNALIIIPFRSPLQQANSLLQQHRRFTKDHAEDPFTLNYMNWLAHHEFGSGHKPFDFSGNLDNQHNVDSLDYWLQTWISTYTGILNTAPASAFFLSYETLCTNTNAVWEKITSYLNIPTALENTEQLTLKENPVKELFTEDLAREADALYNTLKDKEIKP